MENKWFKRLIGLIAIGAAIGGAILYFTKKKDAAAIVLTTAKMILKMKILI